MDICCQTYLINLTDKMTLRENSHKLVNKIERDWIFLSNGELTFFVRKKIKN